eukprot:TRINITY_DN58479_c0_g1_i1.p1 TRINITY_DN58479_c0_g1~~TRINITY_DN58479_c0_g1_i1.p1  ORF type:complete len:650 (+),score=136.86 TRINITY_DN58479_c0_g1_i1:63-2012(+)
MLEPLLWLSPVAQDVLSSCSTLLRGSVPCPPAKLAAALRDASAGTCSGLLGDQELCVGFAAELEGCKLKEISDKTAADLVAIFGKVLQSRSDKIRASAAELAKKLPKKTGLPSYSEVAALLPKGEKPGEALRRDWLLWHSVGCAHNPKELPAPTAATATERITIAACAGSGPSVERVLGLHVLEHIDKYQTWEASLEGNQTKSPSKGIKHPFDEKTTKEVALRRVLGNALPAAIADVVASKVMGGGSVQAVLAELVKSTKTAAVMPMYCAPPAPKEPKEAKGKTDKGGKQADAGSAKSAAASSPAAGQIGDLHKKTATQELQWHLLAYRLKPQTTLGAAAASPTPAGEAPKGKDSASQKSVPKGDAGGSAKPKGFAGTWAPVSDEVPPGHTAFSWSNTAPADGAHASFARTWIPSGNDCPPGHTPYSWEKTGGSTRTPSSSASAKAPKASTGKAPAAKEPAAKAPAASAADAPAEGSAEAALCKLDIRCGRILECDRVPDADSLYLLKINVGEDKPRQVVSSLVKHYKAEELKNRQVVVYCNIKPGKMRGFESQAMVLAATQDKGAENEKCELLAPPEGTAEGTRPMCGKLEVGSLSEGVSVKNISKVWGQVQPLLQTSGAKEAMFEGTTLTMKGNAVTVPSLTGVGIY